MEKSIGKLITYLSRCIQQELKNVVVPFEISVGEEPYYMALIQNNGVTQDELTKLVKVDKAATARMVKSLEQKGYITRETDPKDKRNHACKVVTKKSRPKWTALIISVILRGRRAAAWGTAAARSYRTARCGRNGGAWCTRPFPARP